VSELKAGGLALIVGATNRPEFIGMIVTLVKFLPKTETYQGVDCECDVWVVENPEMYQNSIIINYRGWDFFAAKHLMPINDPGEDITDTNEVPRKDEVSA